MVHNTFWKFLVLFIHTHHQYKCCDNSTHKYDNKKDFLKEFDYFSEAERILMRMKVKEMFYFGYNNYMEHAFPLDELNPIYCSGRGPDKENPDNININDALGGYSLTLIDTLDTLAIMGNHTEFKHAVSLVSSYVNFDQDNVVQVFEATIRVLGGLLAAHLLIVDPLETFGSLRPENYDDDMLTLAHDLGNRLLPAFDRTETGLPLPRVNLRHGVPLNSATSTCTAGAGTLKLEFGILAHLLDDPTFKDAAQSAINALWKLRSHSTGLFGNVVDVETGEWVGKMSGLGAGIDSFYEYLLKSYILFGDKNDLHKFNDIYSSIQKYMRKGRQFCNNGTGETPLYVNVHMGSGQTVNTWMDSLQASFTGVQVLRGDIQEAVLRGDIQEAVCSHALYYGIWKRYGALPERFNWDLKAPDVKFFPLRPEFSEATYLLYQATKHPFYLHVGVDIINSFEAHTKAECGYATVHNVEDKSLEDRMESFFLSETMKYLYLLFDFENPINQQASKWIFSTEGHVFKLDKRYRENIMNIGDKKENLDNKKSISSSRRNSTMDSTCSSFNEMKYSRLPLKEEYYLQIEKFVGLS